MELLDTMLKRKSIRQYTDEKISKEDINIILQAGLLAPSSRNIRPCEFIVVEKKETLEKLSQCKTFGSKMLKDASHAIVVLGNKNKEKSPMYTYQDLSAATENILLEATHLGLGSVWLGVAPNEERMTNLKEIFNLTDDYFAFSIIVIGYPKNEVIKERKYDDSLVHHNKLNKKYE